MKLFFSKTLKIEDFDGFHLLQDHMGSYHSSPWNDYGFVVKFRLYYVQDDVKQDLGYLRILVNGVGDTSKYFLEKGEEVEKNIYFIGEEFDSKIAVSLPLDIDYYHKLHKLLPESDINSFLSLICDASYFYSNAFNYKTWDGFSGALMREGSAAEAIMRKGHQIAMGKYSPEKTFTIDLDLKSESIEPVQFYFNNERSLKKTNINILTGRNGAGKTYILKELSEIITGVKEIDDKWPYFHKLIIVAYSPFENFYTKDEMLDKIDLKYSRGKKVRHTKTPARRRLNVNEYAYVGFRNEAGKFNIAWPKRHSVESLIKILKFDKENGWWDERSRFEILKQTLKLCIDFDNIAVKKSDGDGFLIIHEHSDKNISLIEDESKKDDGLLFIKNGEELKLSSGQIIYSYMIPAIVSEIENESLIILDEPELYLHPHLEVGLIDMMKHLLSLTSSYSIIATHSSILTREVERKGVKILRRQNGKTVISNPGFETYGESLDKIIGEVFDDYATVKPFQNDLRKQIGAASSVEEALSKINFDIGDEALALVVSEFTDDSDYLVENE